MFTRFQVVSQTRTVFRWKVAQTLYTIGTLAEVPVERTHYGFNHY